METIQEIGKRGEELATRYLQKKGIKIIERNFKCRQGEIDIIGKEEKELIFVEVKTRTNLKYGKPREAVNPIKRKHMNRAIEFYLYTNQLTNEQIRIDIMEVYIDDWNEKTYKINHIQNII